MKSKQDNGKPRLGNEFSELIKEYGCTVTDMYEVVCRAMGPNGVHFRTFDRWVHGETAGRRAKAALRILKDHYGSPASQVVAISDPLTALRELQRHAVAIRRIEALSAELKSLIAEATARYEAITEFLRTSLKE